jgi:aspartate aminotransferase-like enzyme
MSPLLMIPGPVEMSDVILAAYNGQSVAHYGSQWTDTYLETTSRISTLFGCSGRTFLMPGSGSLGLESIATTLCADRRCLVLGNGMFGERLLSVVSMQAGKAEAMRFPLDRPHDVGAVRERLAGESFDVVLTVQVETSTGVLNPVRELAQVAKERGSLFLVDAISSAAIERLDMDAWGVDAVVTASQKGFETPPGLAIVTVGQQVVADIERKPSRSWYADLRTWCDYYRDWHDWHPYPVTLPTNNILALSKSLDIIESMGMEKRHRFFKDATTRFRRAFSSLGLKPFVHEKHCAHGLSAISTGGAFDPSLLIAFLKDDAGIQIAGSFGDLKGHVFRIGHMSGEQCAPRNALALVGGVAMFLERHGLQADVAGALKSFSENFDRDTW